MFYHKNLKLMVSQKLEPIGMVRLEASFHVVVGRHNNVGRCIQSSGIELSGLTLEPLASSMLLSQEEEEF
jgi:cell division protein FtsA